jgi:cytochrome oxidase assembly protein ShyY1
VKYVRLGPVQLELEWRLTLLTLLLLPALCSLGLWQLQRADEKRELAAAYEARQQGESRPLESLTLAGAPESLAYQRVTLRGRYVPGQYLLQDNRVQAGRFGYEVIALFALGNGGYALVNRGWVEGDPSRRSLPQVPAVDGELTLRGELYVPPDAPYLLAEQPLPLDGWPQVIQALQMDRLARPLGEKLGAAVFPYSVRLAAGQPGALRIDWPVINVSPQKHAAYAAQWFAMAFALLLLFVLRSSNLRFLLSPRRRDDGQAYD